MTTDHVTLLSPFSLCCGCVAIECFVKEFYFVLYIFILKEIELCCFLGVLSSIL